jgi:hypothetical protein
LPPILFNLYSESLTKEVPEGFGDFKIGGKITSIVKYADGLVLLAKEEGVLQGMTDSLNDIGRCYGMKTNVEKLRLQSQDRHPQRILGSIENNWRMWSISTLWVA